MDQQGNAFSLFQTAINLENRVRSRTEELHSTLRRLEQTNIDLIAAKEVAELANLSKTRFLAAASHDVLQPLNAAHLSVSALAELQTIDGRPQLVRQVERSLETMDDLLRTLLDISKLDAGVVQPDIGDVALDQLFSSLRSDFQPLADNEGPEVAASAPTNAVVRSDRTLLRRILQNIVSNAIRYTRSGGVLVGARQPRRHRRIEIADTGCGIPTTSARRFSRSSIAARRSAEATRRARGLGLGLAIVRRMADALGHRCDVLLEGRHAARSSASTCRSARRSPPSPQRRRNEAEHPRGYGLFGTKVLLVENDADVLAGMRRCSSAGNALVRAATSTDEALHALGDTDWVPDIVIADQHLDDGDLGTATIAEVARLSRPRRSGADRHRRPFRRSSRRPRAQRHRTDAQAGQAGATTRAAGASAGLKPMRVDPAQGRQEKIRRQTRHNRARLPEPLLQAPSRRATHRSPRRMLPGFALPDPLLCSRRRRPRMPLPRCCKACRDDAAAKSREIVPYRKSTQSEGQCPHQVEPPQGRKTACRAFVYSLATNTSASCPPNAFVGRGFLPNRVGECLCDLSHIRQRLSNMTMTER